MIFNADVSGAIGSSVQSGNSELLARFPGESPEERIATEWIKDTYSRLIAAGFGAILRRTTPPHLIALEDSTATSVPAPLSNTQKEKMTPLDVVKYDQLRDKIEKTRIANKKQIEEFVGGQKIVMGAHLSKSLQYTAPVRLSALHALHKKLDEHSVAIPNSYDGLAMLVDLSALSGQISILDEAIDHDRAIELMRDTRLPDGCAVKAFADKVNELMNVHVNHLTRPFTPEGLGIFLIKLMPAVQAV